MLGLFIINAHGFDHCARGGSNKEDSKTRFLVTIICASAKLNWIDPLPLALMSYRMQANRITHLTPHEMLTARPMPAPTIRGPHKGPPLEQLELEIREYIKQLTAIHKLISQQEKSRVPEPEDDPPRGVEPGDHDYLRVFRRHWNEPRREGPYKVIRATPTAIQVEGSTTWYHLNHCTKTTQPKTREESGKDQDAEADEYASDLLWNMADPIGSRMEPGEGGETNNMADLE